MATITEDYVSFETAKLLKEKGFDWGCALINHPQCGMSLLGHMIDNTSLQLTREADLCIDKENLLTIPTLQMVMKWLREVHHYFIEIHYGNVDSPSEPKIQWWWELENKQGEFLEGNITDGNTTYEEACETAIKYCLENLI